MAVLAAYLAACVDHRESLAPGERGVIPLLAATVQQAASAFAFIEGIFAVAPNLKDLVDGATSDTLSLTTGVDIQVRPASFRTIRGIAAIAAIADELAFWRCEDSANPDKEILKALRPSLATTGGPLIAISSPHAKRGELYGTFKPLGAGRRSADCSCEGSQPSDESNASAVRGRSSHRGIRRGSSER
jgi:hypothetical protein